jgi:hypothetical protein
MSVFCLAPTQIDDLWGEIAPHLERLELHGDCLASAIRADLKASAKQLWGYQQDGRVLGVAITSVIETPRGRALEIYGGVGTESVRGQIEDVFSEIKKWAASMGCRRIRIAGRKGWLRRIPELKQVGIIMEMEI